LLNGILIDYVDEINTETMLEVVIIKSQKTVYVYSNIQGNTHVDPLAHKPSC